jgi:hypothetical protein
VVAGLRRRQQRCFITAPVPLLPAASVLHTRHSCASNIPPPPPPRATTHKHTHTKTTTQRWCCNDETHFDISVWAFEKIADKKWGVIPIKCECRCRAGAAVRLCCGRMVCAGLWCAPRAQALLTRCGCRTHHTMPWGAVLLHAADRQVPCDYQPSNLAPAISNPSPSPSQATWGERAVRRPAAGLACGVLHTPTRAHDAHAPTAQATSARIVTGLTLLATRADSTSSTTPSTPSGGTTAGTRGCSPPRTRAGAACARAPATAAPCTRTCAFGCVCVCVCPGWLCCFHLCVACTTSLAQAMHATAL